MIIFRFEQFEDSIWFYMYKISTCGVCKFKIRWGLILYHHWLDINECEAIPGLCEGGKCVNTPGSFTCECPDGQARDPETNSCKDRDECQEEGICADGRCINTNGGYYCLCNPGFIQSQDRRFCIGENYKWLQTNYKRLTCAFMKIIIEN